MMNANQLKSGSELSAPCFFLRRENPPTLDRADFLDYCALRR